MSISFSGLASGLDTSSWVESLVALKQAKVTTLQQEKETAVLSRDTLNSIRSFFASFRSTIEKITDSKFNVVSMDLFAQNLATSANLQVLTATATTEAQEGTYNIKVDKLASNTSAISNYRTTVQKTTVATENSYLKDIGVTEGTIGVTVDGVKYGVAITDRDTIGTFIEKLQKLGVEASYNSVTGVFSANIGANDIDDTINNTGIVDKLHLVGVNEGYKTLGKLEIDTVTTGFNIATDDTLLKDLGVSAGTITIKTNDAEYDITIDDNTKMGEFIAALNANGIEADLTPEGIFILADAVITDEGTTHILTAMGLTQEIYSKSQSTDLLKYQTVVTQTTTATSDTLLKDIGTGTVIADGQNVIVKNSNNEYTTIEVGTATTIGDLLAEMSNAGLYATINSDGIIEISGGTITGGTFDAVSALGLKAEPFTAMTTGNPLTETVVEHQLVNYDTRLVDDLGVTEGYLEVTDPDGNTYYQKIYSGQTIGDLMADLANNGIYSTLDLENGVLEITGGAFATLTDADVQALVANNTIAETDARYQKGTNLLECLYGAGTISTDQISVASAYSRTQILTKSVTNVVAATLDTTLAQVWGIAGGDTNVEWYDRDGNYHYFEIEANTATIQDLIDEFAANGVEVTWDEDHSKLTFNNITLSGDLVTYMNPTQTVAGKYVTSDAVSAQKIITVNATEETTFDELGVTGQQEVVLQKEDGSTFTFTVDGSTTMESFLNTLNSNGVTAKLEDGVFSIEGGYIENTAIVDALGLVHSVLGSSQILGNKLTHTITTTATGDSTLGEVITALGTTSAVSGGYNMSFNSTALSVSADTTIDDLMMQIYNLGGRTSIDSAGRLHVDGGTLTGTVATALGFSSVTTTNGVSATGEILNVMTTVHADITTKFGDLGLGDSEVEVMDSISGTGVGIITTNADMTIGDFFDALAGYGISATIKDGVITLKSEDYRYIAGGIATDLGIEINDELYTVTTGTTNTSSSVVLNTTSVLADSSTTFGELGASYGATAEVRSSGGATLGYITMTVDNTLGDFMTALAGYGISATMKDGVMSFSNPEGNYIVSSTLSYGAGVNYVETTYTVTTGATNTSTESVTLMVQSTVGLSTTLRELGYYSTVDNVVSIYNQNGNLVHSFETNESQTIQDLFDILDDYGIYGSIANGIVTFTSTNGNYATGHNIETALGVGTVVQTGTVTVGIANTSTSSVTIGVSVTAGLDTTLAELGANSGLTYGVKIKDSDNNLVDEYIFNTEQTLADVFDFFEYYGIEATLENGIITLNSTNGNYVSNDSSADADLASFLGINFSSSTQIVTQGVTNTSSSAVVVPTYVTAGLDTTLEELGADSSYVYAVKIQDSNNNLIDNIGFQKENTIGDIFERLEGYGIYGSIEDGIITFTSDNGNYLIDGSGALELLHVLGIGTTSTTQTVTQGVTNTSSSAITVGAPISISLDTTFGEIAGNSDDVLYGYRVMDADNNVLDDYCFWYDDTIGFLFECLDDYGIQGSIENGVIIFNSTNGNYFTGSDDWDVNILDILGVANTATQTVTQGVTNTSSSAVVVATSVTASLDTTLADLGADVNYNEVCVKIRGSEGIDEEYFTADQTIGNVFDILASYGIHGSIENGVITFTSDTGAYLDEGSSGESLVDILGIGIDSITETTTTGISVTSTAVVSKTTTHTATLDTTFGELGYSGELEVCNQAGTVLGFITMLSENTLEDFVTELAGYGIVATLDNGVISFNSLSGAHLQGASFNDNMEFGSETQTITVRGLTSTAAVVTTKQTVAGLDTTFAEMGYASGYTFYLEDALNGYAMSEITMSANSTFGDFIAKLSAHDIEATIENGYFEWKSLGGWELCAGGSFGDEWLNTGDNRNGSCTLQLKGNKRYTLNSSQTFGLHNMVGTGTVVVGNSEGYNTVIVETSDTIDDLLTTLAGLGVTGSVEGGKLTLRETNGVYITVSDNLKTAMKLGYSSVEQAVTVNTSSKTLTYSYTNTLTTDDTLAELGLEYTQEIYVTDKGVLHTISILTTDTVADMLTKFASVGITGQVKDGKLTLTGNKDSYINFIVDELQDLMHFKPNEHYTTTTETTDINTPSSQLIVAGTKTLSSDMTFAELGIGDDSYVNLRSDGVNYTVTIQEDWTVGDFLTTLAGYGIVGSISDGKLTLSGDKEAYITNMDATLESALHCDSFFTTITTITTSSHTNAGGTKTITSDMTFAELGVTADHWVGLRSDGIDYNICVDRDWTVGDFLTTLAGYGIVGSLTDGVLSLSGDKEAYITSMQSGLATALKLDTNNFRTTTEETTYSNTPSSQLMAAESKTLTSDTTFAELGIKTADAEYVNFCSDGVDYSITIQEDWTVGDFLTTLAGYGIVGSITDGKLTLAGDKEAYITSMQIGLAITLKLDANSFRTTTEKTTYANTPSNSLTVTDSKTLTSDTTFAELGIKTADAEYVNFCSDGVDYSITIQEDWTVGDFLTTLAGYGIVGSITDGKLTLAGDKEAYITSTSAGFENAFRMGTENYTTTTETTIANTSGRPYSVSYQSMTTDTTFADLNCGGEVISLRSDGVNYTVTVKAEQTIGDLLTTLAGYGIVGYVEDGKLTLQGDSEAYITEMDNWLRFSLNLTTVNYSTTTASEYTITDSNTLTCSTTNTLTTDDTFASLGLTANGSITVNSDGVARTVTVRTTDTVDDMLTQLASLGITGYVDGGKLTLEGDKEAWITSISDGLKNLLKLSDTNYSEMDFLRTTNTQSAQQFETVTDVATGTTQLQFLRQEDGSAPSGYQLILSTTSNAGNQNVTIDFSATDTVHDVIDTLAGYGLSASIDSAGRFAVESSTLTDFDISGSLGTFLMGAYLKNYNEGSVNNVSTNLVQETVVNMDDSTQLSKLNITNGDIILNKNGTSYTIAIDNTQTVGDFRAKLAEYGLVTDIIDGRMQIQTDGSLLFLTPIVGSSNLVDIMGLTTYIGDLDSTTYSQVSKLLTDTETVMGSATMDSKISELTDDAGASLGVTAGQIYVYQDGTRHVLNINTDDTLQDLANKLSQYGISMDISSNGKIYFNGNNNSYLTTDGIASGTASNILTKLNVSNNWQVRYNSTTETLDYEVTENVVADGDTKLSDLQDADGNNLGITEGNYYVYQNGVRNTESIGADTTLNDFRATMAQYGMTTDFTQDGSLAVGGYNETYLATSATGGDDTNAISVLFEQWDFVNVYTSNGLDVPTDVTVAISETTKFADINEGVYQAGYITVVKDGVQTDIELTADDTVGDLIDELALYGFESVINSNGQLIIKNTGNSLLQAYSGANTASNALDLLGINLANWISTNNYESGTLAVETTTTEEKSSDRNTQLSDMGVTTGEYYIYKDGVKYTAYISSDETLGSFIETLKSFGIETSFVDTGAGSILAIVGSGDSYIATSSSATNKSNVVTQLFTAPSSESYKYEALQQTTTLITTPTTATEDTLLSEFDNGLLIAEGDLSVTVDGITTKLEISADDTIGDLLAKFRGLGLEATLSDGHIYIQSGYKDLSIDTASSTSSVLTNLNLQEGDLGGYVSSNDEVEQTVTEEVSLSVSNYADYNTAMKLLNISNGSLTLYRDGEKATLNIDSEQTFGDLRSQIADKFKIKDVDIKFEDGYLTFFSKTEGVSIEVGSTTDTSNFSAITGVQSTGAGTAKSSRELYCVNGTSKLTQAGLFRNGDIKAGTFYIGDAEFTIDDTTTLSSLISQINASQSANATAFWDTVDGKLVIKSRTTGAALVNIEAGTSNFTDIMGYTKSEWADADGDGNQDIGQSLATVTKMNINAQEVGENARFSINGTYYTSTSNTVGSDVTRINGVTINLKGVSTEGETTLTVERDKETVANAVSDVVDAYNELIENVDKEIAKGSPLDDQFTLKLIRNQIRSLMTSSLGGSGVFKNLDSIGISLNAATAGDIRTDNIDVLTFDKNKFMDAFTADREALKDLLVGTDSNLGIFQRVESVIESAVAGANGYFASAEKSYNNQISRLDDKIKKAQKAVERYRERLEAKFASMDLLISQMQNQYSSFLGV